MGDEMNPVITDCKAPLYRDLYQYLNSHCYKPEDFEDPDLYRNLQLEYTNGVMAIIRPYVVRRPDIRAKYQHADLKVYLFITMYEVRMCIKPVVVDLALDLLQAELDGPPPEPVVVEKLPF